MHGYASVAATASAKRESTFCPLIVSIISKPAVQLRMNQNIRVACVPPGPRGLFSALRMVRNPFASIDADWKCYGDLVRYRFATRPAYLVVHPDGVKQVLQENHRNYIKSSDYKILARLLNEGLLTSEGPLWMRQHRLIVPVFH